ncbi:MAG: hypothetical protein GKR87_07140 [Kiritimatiellae bacterium]|nr:hypothetical protein [Kiritimatiellia bacterium]
MTWIRQLNAVFSTNHLGQKVKGPLPPDGCASRGIQKTKSRRTDLCLRP